MERTKLRNEATPGDLASNDFSEVFDKKAGKMGGMANNAHSKIEIGRSGPRVVKSDLGMENTYPSHPLFL
jgi:hypothetical protein